MPVIERTTTITPPKGSLIAFKKSEIVFCIMSAKLIKKAVKCNMEVTKVVCELYTSNFFL
jgi:hypothetical protein